MSSDQMRFAAPHLRPKDCEVGPTRWFVSRNRTALKEGAH